MDDRLRIPGTAVEGHRGRVRSDESDARPSCSCGRPFPPQPTVGAACLALLLHLEAAVRDGARVVLRGDDDDGLAGVREPRRPLPPTGSGGAEVAP